MVCMVVLVSGLVVSHTAGGQEQDKPPVPAAWVTLPDVEPLDVEGDIIAAGSTTVFPLVQALYKRFIQEGYSGLMKLSNIGSKGGFQLFCETRETDIALASRRIRPKESERCIAHDRTPIPFHLGTGALAIVVHRDNDFVYDVALEELRAIFTAEWWSDVHPDWPREQIRRVLPAPASGTFNFFVHTVLKGKPSALRRTPNTRFVDDDRLIVQGMSQYPYGVSFVDFGYYQQHVDTLRLLSVGGVMPNAEAVAERKYALVRPLLLYSTPSIIRAKPQVRAFINFALTHANEEVMRVGEFPAGTRLLNDSKVTFLQGVGYSQESRKTTPLRVGAVTEGRQSKIVLGDGGPHGAFPGIAYVLKKILERRFGLEIRIVEADVETVFVAMDKGDGSIDVSTAFVIPNRADLWDAYIGPGSRASVLLNTQAFRARQGLFIPGYIQDEHGVTSVADLLNPEIAMLFDSDGNGRGEYWPGEQGWTPLHVELVKAQSYGYAKYFEPYIVELSVFEAWLKTRYEKKQGVLFYSWVPNSLHAAYDLRRVQEPAFDGFAMASKKTDARYNPKGCWRMLSAEEDQDWFRRSRVTCAWPEADVYVAFAKSLLERVPKVAQFLRQVSFDPAMVSQWMYQIRKEGRDPDDVAKVWVQQNPTIVQQWLAGIDLPSLTEGDR